MYVHDTQVRVRYAETDQMGYVYYGNYAQYFECGRVEGMRNLGMSYARLEDSGVMMPVLESHHKFHKAGKYDELLTVKTTIPAMPGVKIRFEYEVFNEQQELIHEGWTVLAFVDMETGKPMRPPQSMLDALSPFFE